MRIAVIGSYEIQNFSHNRTACDCRIWNHHRGGRPPRRSAESRVAQTEREK
jgi:hypothetical protein